MRDRRLIFSDEWWKFLRCFDMLDRTEYISSLASSWTLNSRACLMGIDCCLAGSTSAQCVMCTQGTKREFMHKNWGSFFGYPLWTCSRRKVVLPILLVMHVFFLFRLFGSIYHVMYLYWPIFVVPQRIYTHKVISHSQLDLHMIDVWPTTFPKVKFPFVDVLPLVT